MSSGQNLGEPPIKQTIYCQVIPSTYTISDTLLEFQYIPKQRIYCNTVRVDNFSIYNQFQNILQFYSSFQINVNGQVYQVTIPENQYGFYDIAALITLIQTQLQSQVNLGTWTIVTSGLGNRFITISNNTFTFKLVYSTLPLLSQIPRYLGFSAPNDPSFNIPALSQTGFYPYSVQVTQNINLQLKGVGNLFSDVIGVSVQIPLNVSAGNICYYQCPFYQFGRHVLSRKEKYPITQFSLQLLDDNQQPMQISGQRCSATIVFEEYQIE